MSAVCEARESLCADALTRLTHLMSPAYSPLNADVTYEPLVVPEVTHSYERAGVTHELMELARITHARDVVFQSLLDEVHVLGGEVRLLKRRATRADGTFDGWFAESPYFWLNRHETSPSYLRRIIGIDPTEPRMLASLAHEIEHLRLWKETFDGKRARGLAEADAAEQAWGEVWTIEATLEGERRAVSAEMRMELEHPGNPFNRPYANPGPLHFWERGFIARITYPEYQVVRILLGGSSPQLEGYLRGWIERAEQIRARALDYLIPGDPRRGYWEQTPLLELMLGEFGHLRLQTEDKYDALKVAVARLRP